MKTSRVLKVCFHPPTPPLQDAKSVKVFTGKSALESKADSVFEEQISQADVFEQVKGMAVQAAATFLCAYFLGNGLTHVPAFGCPLSRCCSEVVLITCVRPADSTESVLQGFNNTILAYGQTGTGKTYTILGGTYVDTKKQKKIDELRATPVPVSCGPVTDTHNFLICQP